MMFIPTMTLFVDGEPAVMINGAKFKKAIVDGIGNCCEELPLSTGESNVEGTRHARDGGRVRAGRRPGQ